MKLIISMLFSLLALSFQVSASPPPADAASHPATDAYKGWRLAFQAWTFNRFTFTESVEKAASLGLRWIEVYPGQRVRAGADNVTMGSGLSASDREAVKHLLRDAGSTRVAHHWIEAALACCSKKSSNSRTCNGATWEPSAGRLRQHR